MSEPKRLRTSIHPTREVFGFCHQMLSEVPSIECHAP